MTVYASDTLLNNVLQYPHTPSHSSSDMKIYSKWNWYVQSWKHFIGGTVLDISSAKGLKFPYGRLTMYIQTAPHHECQFTTWL